MTTILKNDHLRGTEPGQPRTLIFSQRNLTQIQPYRCAHFEFEDVIAQVDDAVMVSPRIDPTNWRYPFSRQLAYHTPIRLNPGVKRISLQSDFDLFFAICGGPPDLLRINAISNWRARCRKAICLIDEVWVKEVPNYRNFLRMLRDFDLVVLYYSQSVGPIDEMIGEKRCTFLPPGVDALRFCPYPEPPRRDIDVYSVGRRSRVTHGAYLRMAADDDFFYLHDSTSADHVLDPFEHRNLFANIAKRSRYFIVNPGLIDRPDVRGNQIEIGNRYFEGAAAGNILLGERPRNGEFERFFDWPDSLIDLPYDSPDAEAIVRELDEQPERQARIQRLNVQQSLLRHDWVYRWETILESVCLEGTPRLALRKEKLQRLADKAIGDLAVAPYIASRSGRSVNR